MNTEPNIRSADFLHWAETQKLTRALTAAGIDVRFVGGCVRDALLGIAAVDVDCCTPALPDEVMEALTHAGIRTIPTGIDHGTITALVGAKHFEITTLRCDIACDGRHAEVQYTHDYVLDASRRDFTINAISADVHGTVYDYHNGTRDLQTKQLRFIGDASARIIEDGLRILRLFRFQAQLSFDVDTTALNACNTLKARLQNISAERIKSEIFKLLGTPSPLAAIQSMLETGVWQQIFNAEISGDIAPLINAENALVRTPSALLRFGSLVANPPPANIKTTISQWQKLLALSNPEARELHTWLTHLPLINSTITQAEQKKIQRKVGTPTYQNILLLAAARDGKTSIAAYQKMNHDATAWTIPIFPMTGTDLIALGFPEGVTLGNALKSLEEIWENAEYSLSKTDLLNCAKSMQK